MKLIINKSQKSGKSGWFSGEKNVTLILEISITLSQEESNYIDKYYDPELDIYKRFQDTMDHLDCSPEKLKEIIDEGQCSFLLGDFNIYAETKNGFNDIAIMEGIIKSIEQESRFHVDKLKKLDTWEGKEIKNI